MISKIFIKSEYPYVIAEIGQNHDGSLGQAHAFIDVVADCGADAVKFQTHIADQESTLFEPFRVNFSYEDETRYAYWKRMEFTEKQWKGLYDHAVARGIDFLSSPFSVAALEMLDRIGVSAWKFGSGEVFNRPLLDKAIETGKPIIISTGLSTLKEILEQVEYIRNKGGNVCVLYCVTAYPSKPGEINVRQIELLKKELMCPVGISDHSSTVFPALAAITLGAVAVEVHVTMSRYMFGPDVKASVLPEQLKEIVEGARFISEMLHSENDIRVRNKEQEELKSIFSKSLYYSDSLKKGHVINEKDLIAKKPNCGIDCSDIWKFIGRELAYDVSRDQVLCDEDFI